MKIEIKNKEYTYITDDSRIADSGGAFLLTHHNSKYKGEVEEKGCKTFLTPAELFKQWDLSSMKIMGITGTNGKTTITNIIAHILKNAGQVVAVSGTEGIFLHRKSGAEKIAPRTHTTPEILTTLVNLKTAKESGANFFVMEVSSHGIHQKRIEGLEFDAKVFTNLTQDHLDFHETMEEYAAVKSSFFSDSKPSKIINADDQWIKYNKENTKTYSLQNNDADLFATNTDFKNGIVSDIFWENHQHILSSKMIGQFNLYNILAAVGAVIAVTKLEIDKTLRYLSDFSGVAGRMELLHDVSKNNAKMEVFSDYAHTPDATENVLTSIPKDKKIITVIGAGGDRDASKRPIMAKIATENSDYVFLTSDNPRTEKVENILADMEKGVKDNYKNYVVVEDRKEAIEKAIQKAEEFLGNGDSVVVAILGKGDEDYIDIMGEKIPYSDKKEVTKYFSKVREQ